MYPPRKLTPSERSIIGRDLARAQAALERARKSADVGGDRMLAKGIEDQLRGVGEQILAVYGTPKTTIAELIS